MDFGRVEALEASAFFIAADGLLVTCAHVVTGGTPLGIFLPGGRTATVRELVALDEESDLAILRIDGGDFSALPISPKAPTPGQRLRAVTKDGRAATSCVGRALDGDVGEVITFEAGGHGPGASGGALIDVGGRVVGVIRGGFEGGEREGVAVPVARLTELLAELSHAAEDGP